ncbi:WxcM-like domain-containing protein [Chryseobacterium vrystaatense]|uniref:Sugar epimerase n=1 Tax=Chryseobacterium vrystaatense TaxID=307480 RepID=A0A1M5MT25_9FLAO|nr:WxcM-like domain-containing protein [Chryseobacterium vrystaatense]KFF24541.1 sugar epimerase [Chryseobacterium vrystaatense]SHG80391.1 WxcM-like, C-terminal [Chryseobacterium vrystaatense]
MEIPELIGGGKYSDERGSLFFNNSFDAAAIKRIYFIENADTQLIRGWAGHKIEQRWFSAVRGGFLIKLIKIDNWETPSAESEILEFEVNAETLDVLHMPKGYVSAIQAKTKEAKLLVMVDHALGEVDDDYRFPVDYFKKLS